MGQNFTSKSTPEIDAIVRGSGSHEEMREKLLAAMAAAGQIVRTRTGSVELDNQTEAAERWSEPDPQAAPTSGFKFEREIRFSPESGKRTLVIRATTQSDLDALEAQILARQ